MKKKYLIPLAVLLLAAAAAVILLTQGGKPAEPAAGPAAATETASTEPAAAAETAVAPEALPEETKGPGEEKTGEKEQPFLVQITADDPSVAYVLVRLQSGAGLLPLPLEGEYKKTIRQLMPDGSEAVNVLHLTPNGFRMEESNCEGHDCIDEGEVTLENREERVLWNMVICLPHQLSAELITREEAEQLTKQ